MKKFLPMLVMAFGLSPWMPPHTLGAEIHWTAAQSPILLANDYEVPPGDTLTVEAGVTVQSTGAQRLIIPYENSTLRVLGTTNLPVNFIAVGINAVLAGNVVYADSLRMTNGYLQAHLTAQSLRLTNCHFSNGDLIVRAKTNIIDRSVFLNCRLSHLAFASVRNNVFAGWADHLISWPGTECTIRLNSFLDTQRPVIQSSTFDLSQNYWGTTDPAVIANRIRDGNDTFSIAGYVTFAPFLTFPDSNTPPWPPQPVAPPIQPEVSITTSVRLQFPTQSLAQYTIEGSNDMTNWVALASSLIGNGGTIQWYCPADQQRKFFRVTASW